MSQQLSSLNPQTANAQTKDRTLRLIAVLKLLEGFLILATAFGVLKLLHHDVAGIATDWIAALRIDPENEHIHLLLAKLSILDDHRLKQISAGSFVYAALSLTEGLGLQFKKRWAEFVTVIATGFLIPVEIHELILHASLPKAIVFAINVAVVAYLIVRLRQTREQVPAEQAFG
ncbi:MAG TPA: DUF2127 domain-containing protein [Pirellulales bacterium]|jgi:uncharacterized membrane protein (DUF2068 family)|nr:DUF2127 domain-containing protein [Pirellulales bacterium]